MQRLLESLPHLLELLALKGSTQEQESPTWRELLQQLNFLQELLLLQHRLVQLKRLGLIELSTRQVTKNVYSF